MKAAAVKGGQIEHFYSGGQQPCKFMGTKKCAYLRKECGCHRIIILVGNNNMAAVSLFLDTKVAAVKLDLVL